MIYKVNSLNLLMITYFLTLKNQIKIRTNILKVCKRIISSKNASQSLRFKIHLSNQIYILKYNTKKISK
jgi:hypothetical protein